MLISCCYSLKHPHEQFLVNACREASEKRAEAQGLMGVAERNAQLTADLAAAQERAEAVEQALEERDAHAEAEQLLLHRVGIYNFPCCLALLARNGMQLKRSHHCCALLRLA